MGWSRLHDSVVNSLTVAELIEHEPDAAVLWFMMIGTGGVWGRFRAEPQLLHRRVFGLVERMTPQRTQECIDALVERGMLQRYTDDEGRPLVAITNWFRHNPGGGWHRVRAPELPAPPGFTTPSSLLEYLARVADGRYRSKRLTQELVKFGVDAALVPITQADEGDDHGQVG